MKAGKLLPGHSTNYNSEEEGTTRTVASRAQTFKVSKQKLTVEDYGVDKSFCY